MPEPVRTTISDRAGAEALVASRGELADRARDAGLIEINS